MQRVEADDPSPPAALGVVADRDGVASSARGRKHKPVPIGKEKGTANSPIANRLAGVEASEEGGTSSSPTRLVRRFGIDARKEQRERENTILKRLYRLARSLLLLITPRHPDVGTNTDATGSNGRRKSETAAVRVHRNTCSSSTPDTKRKESSLDADTDLSPPPTDYFMIKNCPRTIMDRVLYRFRQQPLLKLWSLVLVVVELLVLYEFCVLRAPAHVASAWLSEGYPTGRSIGGVPQKHKQDDAHNNLAAEGAAMMSAYASTPIGDALFVSQFMCLIIPRALFYLFYENIAVAAFAAFIHVGEIFHFWALGKAQGRAYEERNPPDGPPYNWRGDQYFVFGFILVNGPLYVYHLFRLVRLIISPRVSARTTTDEDLLFPPVAVAEVKDAERREGGVSGPSSIPLLDLHLGERAIIAPKFYHHLLMGCRYFSHYGVGLLWNASRAVLLMWLALEMLSGVWIQHPSKRASEVNSFFFKSLHTEDATIIAISVTIVASVGLFLAALAPFFQRTAPRSFSCLCGSSRGVSGTHMTRRSRERDQLRPQQEGQVSSISNVGAYSCHSSSIFAARAPVSLMGICVELFILLPMTVAAILEYSNKINEEEVAVHDVLLGHN